MNLSICMIAKNEEKVLERCLSALKPLQAEIVFVDTGSSDDTVSIAKRHTGRVYNFPWEDDFSAARNFCISKASHNMILSLDCDEILDWDAMGNPDPAALEEELYRLFAQHPGELGRITLHGEVGRDGEKVSEEIIVRRIFNQRVFTFEGAIHEQLVWKKDRSRRNSSYPTPLVFHHLGYAGNLEERRQKAERNNRLLFKEREKHPHIGYYDYQIGKSFLLMEENAKALPYLESALEKDFDRTAESFHDLVRCYGNVALEQGKIKEAMRIEQYRDTENNADYATLLGKIYARNGLWEKALEEFSRALDYPTAEYEGGNTYMPLFFAGAIYESIGDMEMAAECLKASADMGYALAKEEYDRLFTIGSSD